MAVLKDVYELAIQEQETGSPFEVVEDELLFFFLKEIEEIVNVESDHVVNVSCYELSLVVYHQRHAL